MRRWPAFCILTSLLAFPAFAQQAPVAHVSGVMPVQAPSRALSAVRPASEHLQMTQPVESVSAAAAVHTWKLLATLPGVIHDVSFASPLVGFAAGEHGLVYKTIDGGNTWNVALSSDTNDYFYGVQAISAKDIIVSGFYDSATLQQGAYRWSHDGGKTWTADLNLGKMSMLKVRFAKGVDGLILNLADGSTPTGAEYTSNGGKAVVDWKHAVANPSGAWFDPGYSLLTNLHARASGINFCTSLTGGSSWGCVPSVDSVFDGPVFFLDDLRGWVGGGEIAPAVEGWMHATTDGGKTWTARTLDGPWPIRSVLFLTTKVGWAAGGNIYTGVGGIYFTSDGGQTWTVDATTGAEMGSCTQRGVSGKRKIWCAGFQAGSGYSSVIYSTTY